MLARPVREELTARCTVTKHIRLLVVRVEAALRAYPRFGLVRRSARMATLNAWAGSAKSHFRRKAFCSTPFAGTRSEFSEGRGRASIGHRSVANRKATRRVMVFTWAKAEATGADEPVRIGCASGSWPHLAIEKDGRFATHAPSQFWAQADAATKS